MSEWRAEAGRVVRLSGPVAATQLAMMLLWTIDLVMVGRVEVAALNAVSLGRLWIMGTLICGMGLIYGLDALAAQAHGADDEARLGSVLRHGLALGLAIAAPMALLFALTGPVLRLLGQEPEVAALAHRFVVVQIPGLPFFFAFIALRQFLQARGLVRPAMWVTLLANVVNLLANWLLVLGPFGLPRLGVVGAGLATAITEVVMPIALWALVRREPLLARAWQQRAPIARAGISPIVRLGVPIAAQLALEYWTFALATVWAGWFGTLPLAAHSIALNLASLTYMVPLGISSGAATRVGNLIGSGDGRGARRAAWVSLALGAGVMLAFAALFIFGGRLLPRLYSRDGAAVAATAAILPIVAAFELFDGLQVVGGGVLRGMGRPRPAALFNLIGYWVAALPLAWFLAFRLELGVAGIWWGLAVGLFLVAAATVGFLLWRGPETAEALA